MIPRRSNRNKNKQKRKQTGSETNNNKISESETGGEEQKYRHGNSHRTNQEHKHTLYSYLIPHVIEDDLIIDWVSFGASAHPARWVFGNVHTSGWFDWTVVNLLFDNMKFIVWDGPQFPNRPKGTMEGPYKNTRFLHLLARNRSITEDGPDLA